MPEVKAIDDQPISAAFFGEGKWLTEFITPDAIDVIELHENLTEGLASIQDKIAAMHAMVAGEIKYKKFIQGKLWIDGKSSIQNDLWNSPSVTSRLKVGNCANKAFLMTSLLRRSLPADQVHCVLGNLYNGKVGGHAWVQVTVGGQEYVIETTRADVPAMILAVSAERYEPVHFFNDMSTYSVEGRTVMEPYTACFSSWLSEYLDWAYIEGAK